MPCWYNSELPHAWHRMRRLEHVDLGCNGLAGSLPPEWRHWGAALKGLWLDGNELTGQLPAAWAHLCKLETLDVSMQSAGARDRTTAATRHVGLGGTLPPDWGPNLRRLTSLDAKVNGISGPLPPEW